MNIEELKKNFIGEIILPGDSNYEEVSTVFALKGNPRIIFRPTDKKSIATAIQYAKDNKAILSIRSGGHSGAGFSTNNDGVVIDLSHINSVQVIDEENNIVRIGAGAKWGDVAKTLQANNLAITSGDTKSVGVGGLILGAGIGWLVRKYGLTIDNMVAAEIITADGTVVRATEKEHSDLFWAIRGGGGNFGVVSYFEIKAQKVEQVFFGNIMYSFENVSELLKSWRDYMRKADDLLTTTLMIMPSMGGAPAGIMMLVCYGSGDDMAAEKAIAPLKKMGKVLNQAVNKMPYSAVLQEAHAPQGVKVIVKSTFIEDLSDELIHTIDETHGIKSNRFLMMRYIGGALNKVKIEDTAFAYRKSEILVIAPIFLPPTTSEDQNKALLKPWETIAAFGKGAYSNFLSTTTEEDVKAIYPEETYKRLVEVKKKYDPENLFSQNYNVKPV